MGLNEVYKPSYTKEEIDKIGNTLIYLQNKLGQLTKTQALKFLYFLDEFSIKKYGIPFLGLDYEVWQLGPVSKDIYVELTSSENPKFLKEYVSLHKENYLKYKYEKIKSIKPFCNDEFSDNDIKIMDITIKKFKGLTSSELSKLTHKKGSLWYNSANKNNLLEPFKKGSITNSKFKIDFNSLLNEEKLSIFKFHKETQQINRHYT
jgi:uncharacterized phage-associated protein